MSILLRLKNKLHDPPPYEVKIKHRKVLTKIREFDECITTLKHENLELHRRLDQLEVQCKQTTERQEKDVLQDYVRQLELENDRLMTENQIQREEYERFLQRLTPMVLRTAMMQENIRQECASIFHIVERLSILTENTIEDKYAPTVNSKAPRIKCTSLKDIHQSSLDNTEEYYSSHFSRKINRSNRQSSEPPTDKKLMKLLPTKQNILYPLNQNKSTTSSPCSTMHRSETFIVSKKIPPPETNNQIEPVLIEKDKSINRPSKLPARRSTWNSSHKATSQSTTVKTRLNSTSTDRTSKVPVRTTVSNYKSHVATTMKTMNSKKDSNLNSSRISSAGNANSTKKSIRISLNLPSVNERVRPTPNSSLNRCSTVKQEILIEKDSNECFNEKMNSTSSDSSIEIKPIQDEGYSTWSSADVKEDRIEQSIKINNTEQEKLKSIGLVKNWLDENSNQQNEENSLQRSNNEMFHHSSLMENSSDSLEQNPTNNESTALSSSSSSSSSSGFSRSETFERILMNDNLAQLAEKLSNSTNSTISNFNMSEYIEDKMMEPSFSTDSSSSGATFSIKNSLNRPEKRLLAPGSSIRFSILRRVSSDSNLKSDHFSIDDNERQYHVYHSNTIYEHSIEVNLINTYGSDSELQAWSHDCAEQRRLNLEHSSALFQHHQEDYQEEQLAIERQLLLQQIYEYPWLLQENDLDRIEQVSGKVDETLLSPRSDVNLPSPNPGFYQLCPLTRSGSFRLTQNPTTASVNNMKNSFL